VAESCTIVVLARGGQSGNFWVHLARARVFFLCEVFATVVRWPLPGLTVHTELWMLGTNAVGPHQYWWCPNIPFIINILVIKADCTRWTRRGWFVFPRIPIICCEINRSSGNNTANQSTGWQKWNATISTLIADFRYYNFWCYKRSRNFSEWLTGPVRSHF
jgi:hypothetical protein